MSIDHRSDFVRNERGFVLVAALSCLVVLSFIGIAAMNTSNTERQIAHNINLAEKTFYRTDGATETGIEMIEWNLSCPLGFAGKGIDDTTPVVGPGDSFVTYGIDIFDSAFAYREDATGLPWDPTVPGLGEDAATLINRNFIPSDGARSMRLRSEFGVPPADNPAPGIRVPHINLAIFGPTSFGAGGSIQMAAGYEGKGKGAAGGGSVINYELWAQTFGINNAESVIRLGWQHLIGTEGICRPY